MYTTRAIPIWSGAGAARDGFVVPKALDLVLSSLVAAEAKSEIVAVTLGGGTGLEGFEDDVRDALRGEDVAANDGRVVGGG